MNWQKIKNYWNLFLPKSKIVIKQNNLNPVCNNLENMRTEYSIEEDGTIIVNSRLVMEQKKREEAIAHCFLKLFYKKYKIFSRDSSWDFGIKISNGNEFFIEITEFTDDENKQKNIEKEIELKRLTKKETDEYGKIKKVIEHFNLKKIILKQESGKGIYKRIVSNPLYKYEIGNFIGMHYRENVVDNILGAIEKKEKKKEDKLECILILDNRATYFNEDDVKILKEKIEQREKLFKSIFIITMYGASMDNPKAEFCLLPIVCDEKEIKILDSI